MKTVLKVENVHKSLSKREIIKGISFEVKEGEIFGFLGANGAGKTTTIRMLVGLIKPDKGNIEIMGYNIQKNLVKALKQVGCIVENPDMYNDLTGRENLKVFARMYGNVSKERIEEVIELIGLKDRIDDKVKKYSLGMKQRLGLGQALLPNPKLLILDEPSNGLDPVGIVEFRNIIKKMAKENNTAVFISSHILAEMEQTCDKVAFIKAGVIESIEEMNNLSQAESYDGVALTTTEKERCKAVLGNLNYVQEVQEEKEKLLLRIDKDAFATLITDLAKENIPLQDIQKIHENLEGRFMRMVEGGREHVELSKK